MRLMKTFKTFSVAALAAIALSACGNATSVSGPDGMKPSAQSGCHTRAYPEIGGPISLVDHTGKAVTEADYKGQSALIFFGFTHCPDVCPMALVTVGRAYAQLPDDVVPPQTLFVSIDPERDTPEQLATYISTEVFPDNLVGLTGSPEAVRAAADGFIADYSRVDDPSSAVGYTMDHTSLLYLMDEDWQLKTFFTHEDTAETISACLADLAKP